MLPLGFREQRADREAEGIGDLLDGNERGRDTTALHQAHVGAVDPDFRRERLLGVLRLCAQASDSGPELLLDREFHPRTVANRRMRLYSISTGEIYAATIK